MRGYKQQNTEEPILHDTQLQKDIESLRARTKWIDINQFLEGKRYFRIHSIFHYLLYIGVLLCLGIIIGGLYYVNTEHIIYSWHTSEQVSHVYGLENMLLKLDVINSPVIEDEEIGHLHSYKLHEGMRLSIMWGIIFAIVLRLLWFVDSSKFIKNIYNIQDGDKKLRFRIVEDTKGRKGICNAGRLRLRQLLPFEYDEIFATYDTSYVCKKDGKYGVYNADFKKMAIPVIYDDIYSISPESIVLIKDEQKHCLTYKGYRIVK